MKPPRPYDGSERLDLDAIFETRPQAAGWRADIEYLIKRVRWLEAHPTPSAIGALMPAWRDFINAGLADGGVINLARAADALVAKVGERAALDFSHALVGLVISRMESRHALEPQLIESARRRALTVYTMLRGRASR